MVKGQSISARFGIHIKAHGVNVKDSRGHFALVGEDRLWEWPAPDQVDDADATRLDSADAQPAPAGEC